MNFEGKKVIVTGAGKGIGRVVAEILVKRGAKVAALTRSADDVVSLREDLGCQAIQVDLADANATREAVRNITLIRSLSSSRRRYRPRPETAPGMSSRRGEDPVVSSNFR